jgi:hypothetical protein
LLTEPRLLKAEFQTTRGKRNELILSIITGALLTLILVLALVLPPGRDDAEKRVIILQQIENATGAQIYDELAVTLGDLLIAELARSGSLSVRKSIPSVISQALSNDFVEEGEVAFLSGRLVRQEDQLILSTYLENRQTTKITWGHQQLISEGQLLPGAAAISKDLMASLNINGDHRAGQRDENNQARELYSLARQLAAVKSNVTIKLAHGLLLQAIEIDPQFGAAHGLLAELYSWHYPVSFWGLEGGRFEHAERELDLARQFGADEAYVMVTQAGIYLSRDRRYDLSRKLLEQAAALRPDDPWVLRPQIWTNMLHGDFAAALANNLKAARISLDPSSVLSERVVPLYYAGRYQEAYDLHLASNELGLKPTYQGPQAAIMSGDQAAGFGLWVDYVRQQGVVIEDETLPMQWAREGQLQAAYNWLRDRAGHFKNDWTYPLMSASWQLASGDKEKALEETINAIKTYRTLHHPEGTPSYAWTLFFYDPLFAELRNDPRIKETLNLL